MTVFIKKPLSLFRFLSFFCCSLWKNSMVQWFHKIHILEDISPFCGAHVLYFWWSLPWVSKPGWILCLCPYHLCTKHSSDSTLVLHLLGVSIHIVVRQVVHTWVKLCLKVNPKGTSSLSYLRSEVCVPPKSLKFPFVTWQLASEIEKTFSNKSNIRRNERNSEGYFPIHAVRVLIYVHNLW